MKKIINLLFIFLIIIISYEILYMRNYLINSVNTSFSIWKNNIFPSSFPFLIISNIIITYGISDIISWLFKPLGKIFKIDSKCLNIFILSILSGFPSAAIYARKYYDEKEIDSYCATKVLTFSHFSNPLFILNNLSIILGKKEAILVLIIHYFTNILIGIIFSYYHPSYNYNCSNIKNIFNNSFNKINKYKIGNVLSSSIKNTISSLLTILGSITLFLCLSTIVINVLNLDEFYTLMISGLFEITQGFYYLNIINISIKLKSIIAIIFLSFGGISIHMQMISFISDTNIKYYPYLIARIIHSIISGILVYFLYDFFI